MRAGLLRHVITLRTRTNAANTMGEPIPTTSSVATCRAQIIPLSGTETDDTGQPVGLVTHEVRIRYQTGLSPIYQAVYGSRVFDVVTVLTKDERNHEVSLMCKEVLTG